MTVMTLGVGRGKLRCDARCHEAKHDECTCICGGKNHGLGLQKAMENSALIGHELLARAERKRTGQLQLFAKDPG